MKSIRRYLVVITLSVICLSNFSAALHGYRDSLAAADLLLDHHVTEKLNTLLELIQVHDVMPAQLFDENTLYQVWQSNSLIASSDQAPRELFVAVDQEFHDVSYQGRRWRAIGETIGEQDVQVIVASRLDTYSALTENILLRAIVPIIWILPVVGLLVWLVIKAGMKPLSQLANSISHREANDFNLLENKSYPGELTPIVLALNNLFYRLEQTFEREKRFSADAAHELRTPLAVFKVNLYNLAKAVGDTEELNSLRHAADRMEHSIEQLLALHRVSHDATAQAWQPVDLYKVAQEVIAETYEVVAARQQTIELNGSQAWVLAETIPLSIMLRNLIDNASKYTPVKGTIHITVEEYNGCSNLLIEDSGPGIPESEYPRVMDRFYRVGGDRHHSQVVGSGLGLSIVSFVAELFKGNIYFSNSSTLGGLAVKLSFPSFQKQV